MHTEVRGQLCGSRCSPTLYYPWLNSRHTTWQQEPLSAGQSHQRLACFYMCALTLTFSSPFHHLPQDDKARRAWHLDSECLLCRIEVFFFSVWINPLWDFVRTVKSMWSTKQYEDKPTKVKYDVIQKRGTQPQSCTKWNELRNYRQKRPGAAAGQADLRTTKKKGGEVICSARQKWVMAQPECTTPFLKTINTSILSQVRNTQDQYNSFGWQP